MAAPVGTTKRHRLRTYGSFFLDIKRTLGHAGNWFVAAVLAAKQASTQLVETPSGRSCPRRQPPGSHGVPGCTRTPRALGMLGPPGLGWLAWL